MSDPIEPALTPEQWRERMLPGVVCADVRYDSRARQWTHELSIFHADAKKDSLHAVLTPEQAHGVAALMLHQQPFGFTHEMLDALRDAVATWGHAIAEDVGAYITPEEHRAKLEAMQRALANIAALLPPEKE